MDRATIDRLLASASQECIEFSQQFLVEELPRQVQFVIFPNCSNLEKPLQGDAEVYPQDSLPDGQYLGPMDRDAAVTFVWRNGKLPQWINVYPHSVDSQFTFLGLQCSSQYYVPLTSDSIFSVKGPAFPAAWFASMPMDWATDLPNDYNSWVERLGRFELGNNLRRAGIRR